VQPIIAQQSVQTAVSQAETVTNAGEDTASASKPVVRSKKVKPNDPCPCGSGKKYKHCHGSVASKQTASVV